MKRILILTAGYGEGHNSAARGIRDGFAEISPAETKVEIHDLFAETYGALNEFVRTSYLHVINHAPVIWTHVYGWLDRTEDFASRFSMLGRVKRKLAQKIESYQPDVIVSVYPTYSHLLDEILGPAGSGKPRRIVMITDSITINAIWFRCRADYFLVPNAETAQVLRNQGVDPKRILAFGFPVSPKFARQADRHPRSPNEKWRVLHLVNARKRQAPALVARLAALPKVKLIAAVGHDSKLAQTLERVRASSRTEFEILGWSDKLPELLRQTDLLVSKAGGATVQEAIAAACPIIVNHAVPGQEEGNARLITQNNAGADARSTDDVIATVESALANDGAELQIWKENVQRMSRPSAALEIASFLLSA